jgi:hypothetical protein
MKTLFLVVILLLCGCRQNVPISKRIVHTEIIQLNDGYTIGYIFTDVFTGKKYLLNYKGGVVKLDD